MTIQNSSTDTGFTQIQYGSSDNFSGNLFGYWQTSSGPDFSEMYSLFFNTSSSSGTVSNLNQRFYRATINQGFSSINGNHASYFDTSGNNEILPNAAWSSNISQTVINRNLTSNENKMTYAWQAGTGDSHSRAFNATTNESTGVGYAWYGYAAKFDQTGGTHTDAVIEKMICNWAGDGNDHNVSNTNAQAQKNLIQ